MAFSDWALPALGGLPGAAFTKGGKEFLFGKPSKMKPFNQGSLDWLQNLLQPGQGIEGSELFGGGSDFLKGLYGTDEDFWKAYEDPMRRQFEQETLPGVAERFAGMGTGAGALNSSGLNNSLATAARQFQQDLSQQRGQMRMQGLPQLMGFAKEPFSQKMQAATQIPGQYYEKKGKEGMLQNLMQILAQVAGAAF